MQSILLANVVACSMIAAGTPAPPAPAPVAPSALGEAPAKALAEALAAAAPDALVPVYAVMDAHVARADIARLSRIANRADRRAAIIGALKDVAAESQRDVLATLRAAEADGRAARVRPLWIANLVAADVTPALAAQLAAHPDVHRLAHNPTAPVFDVPDFRDAPAGAGNLECGVDLMDADRVWQEYGLFGDGVVVALIDSGTCYRHPDLENHIWSNPGEIPDNDIDDDGNGYVDDVIGWNFHLGNNDPDDFLGHGTHVGGTIVGDGTQGTITGMAQGARLMLLRVSGQLTEQEQMWVWSSMQYGVDNEADMLSMSYGWHHDWNPDRAVWREISENAIAMGVVPVIAAHNFGGGNPPHNVTTPGDVPDVVTVGATDCNDLIAGFSSRGPTTWQGVEPYNDWPYPPGLVKPTISAPGVNTTSCRRCTGYTQLSGTSMATPHVAGAVALMLEANPNLTVAQVKSILAETSLDRGAEGWDNDYGAGRVQAYAAVTRALEMATPGDIDGDGDIDFADLLLLLAAWGPCDPCDEDLDGNGLVDFADLLLLLSNWTG